jgi:hypothetical protein
VKFGKKKYIYFKYSSTTPKNKCGAAEEWWATDPKNIGYIPACVSGHGASNTNYAF